MNPRASLMLLSLWGLACARVAGVDGDYREVDTADSGASGAAGSATGGAPSGGGSAGAAVGGTSGTSGTGGAGGAGGAGGGPACSSIPGKQCVEAVPAGFLGPVVYRESATAAPSCPPEYPTAGNLIFGGFDAGVANCDCECAKPSSPCSVTLRTHTHSQCLTVSVASKVLPANVCTDIDVDGGQTARATGVPNDCTAVPTSNIAPPSFADEGRYCGGADLEGSCAGGELCAPAISQDARLCVRQDGDVSCPATGYTDKLLRYEGFVDSRACTACSCGSPTGSCGSVSMFAVNCSQSPPNTLNIGECKSYAIKVFQARYQPSSAGVSCPAQGGQLSGSANPTVPTTLCCLP